MQQYAERARERRLSGNHHNNGDLTGFCFDNALVLYNTLTEAGYTPKVVCGASERYSDPILENKNIDDIKTVEELNGYVHYWVECNGKVIDIASDIPKHLGEIIIRDKIPNSYYRLENSYEYAMDIVRSAGHRCNYCGGVNGDCGCPEENTI